jgi:hypothetical protein
VVVAVREADFKVFGRDALFHVFTCTLYVIAGAVKWPVFGTG